MFSTESGNGATIGGRTDIGATSGRMTGSGSTRLVIVANTKNYCNYHYCRLLLSFYHYLLLSSIYCCAMFLLVRSRDFGQDLTRDLGHDFNAERRPQTSPGCHPLTHRRKVLGWRWRARRYRPLAMSVAAAGSGGRPSTYAPHPLKGGFVLFGASSDRYSSHHGSPRATMNCTSRSQACG